VAFGPLFRRRATNRSPAPAWDAFARTPPGGPPLAAPRRRQPPFARQRHPADSV